MAGEGQGEEDEEGVLVSRREGVRAGTEPGSAFS